MTRNLTTLLLALTLAGCGSADAPLVKPPPAAGPGLTTTAGVVTARGDVAPEEYGPLTLGGRYEVTYAQEGAGVDFTQEVPFTAHLEETGVAGAPERIELFEKAARTGRRTITARGRFALLVDFGDSPFTVKITRLPR